MLVFLNVETCFVGVEVFSMKPLVPLESRNLNRISSYVSVIKLYTHRVLASKTQTEFPVEMCEQLVGVMLDLIDDLGKGNAAPRRYENISDYCSETKTLDESSFAQLVGKSDLV